MQSPPPPSAWWILGSDMMRTASDGLLSGTMHDALIANSVYELLESKMRPSRGIVPTFHLWWHVGVLAYVHDFL